MDVPIKLKAYGKAAIDYLNRNVPEIYQGKNPGFRWASHTTARKSGIDWGGIGRIRIENKSSSGGFSDDDNSISYLTIDGQTYEKLRNDINQQLNMTWGVQKAFLTRVIIKWGLGEMRPIAGPTNYAYLVYEDKQDLNSADTLKLCVDLFYNSEEDSDRAEVREQIRKLLMGYQKKMKGR